ncbi:sensor histidine kinase [Nocardioides sp. DS6]|uniref:Sensor histidine kinase n=1 Tax=Nocardioides eburneus TaxID=3231482 RepID=A0ABV3SWV9_9ACTN
MFPGRQQLRLAATARLFVLVALLVPVLWAQDATAVFVLLAIGAVWVLTTLAEAHPGDGVTDRAPGTIPGALTVLEGIAIGALCGVALNDSRAVLGALVVPPFVAGLCCSVRGLLRSLAAVLGALAAVMLAAWQQPTPDQAYAVFSWCFAGLGLGLIGAFLHGMLHRESDPLAPYRHAQSLLRRLISISHGLDTDLDPVALGGEVLTEVGDVLPTSALALYVPRGDALTPLLTRSLGTEELTVCEEVGVEAWTLEMPVVVGRYFAFPLATDAGTAGVVVGALSERVDPDSIGLAAVLQRLGARLRDRAVHLDTALLFAAFRDSATTEERRRLAREMHDGVAQDLASLGYFVDALAAGGPVAPERLQILRERISAIVAEVRRSLVSLRTNVGASESLGAALGTLARNLAEVSGVPVHVTLDEHTDRLRPEVEGELFRIAQEALNNAVKHARARRIDVHCQVRAPEATITVTDDGLGFQGPRRGSHGLSIMRERAHLIGADLTLSDTPGGGLTVTVTVPAPRSPGRVRESVTQGADA